MATKHTDSCLQKAGDDEPIFVLRAQDRIAPMIVRAWAREAQARGCYPEKVEEAHRLADLMLEWQQSNPSKDPD